MKFEVQVKFVALAIKSFDCDSADEARREIEKFKDYFCGGQELSVRHDEPQADFYDVIDYDGTLVYLDGKDDPIDEFDFDELLDEQDEHSDDANTDDANTDDTEEDDADANVDDDEVNEVANVEPPIAPITAPSIAYHVHAPRRHRKSFTAKIKGAFKHFVNSF